MEEYFKDDYYLCIAQNLQEINLDESVPNLTLVAAVVSDAIINIKYYINVVSTSAFYKFTIQFF